MRGRLCVYTCSQLLGRHKHRLHPSANGSSHWRHDRHRMVSVADGLRGAVVRLEGSEMVRARCARQRLHGVTGHWLPDLCDGIQFLCAVAGDSGAVLADISDGPEAHSSTSTGRY